MASSIIVSWTNIQLFLWKKCAMHYFCKDLPLLLGSHNIIIPSACRQQHRHHQYLQYLCNNNIHHAGIQTDYIWHQWGLFGEKYCKKLHLNSAVRQVKWKCRWIETAIAENTTTELQSNWENREHQKYFWNIIVLHEKSQSGLRN